MGQAQHTLIHSCSTASMVPRANGRKTCAKDHLQWKNKSCKRVGGFHCAGERCPDAPSLSKRCFLSSHLANLHDSVSLGGLESNSLDAPLHLHNQLTVFFFFFFSKQQHCVWTLCHVHGKTRKMSLTLSDPTSLNKSLFSG